MYVCMHVCMYVWMYICMYTLYMYACMYVCMYIYMYVCIIYVCMYVCNYINLIGVDVNVLQTKKHWWQEIVLIAPLHEVRVLYSTFPVIRIEYTFKTKNRSKVMYQVRCNACRTGSTIQPYYGFRIEARNLTVTNLNYLFPGKP